MEHPTPESTADLEIAPAEKHRSSQRLFHYVLAVGGLVFMGRSMPLGFLPIAMRLQFQQSDGVTGMVLALYPFAAMIATPWASALARKSF